ncbi:MAG: glycosyltransferase [Verrucomicrobiaceae bacterium]|nr:glycosyltransferase [Verrucomicrobiaceae bacterium]
MPVMARGLAAAGVEVHVATIDETLPEGHSSQGAVSDKEGFQRLSFGLTCRPYRVSVALGKWLARHVVDYDLVHVHGVFTYSSWAACRAAAKARVPFVVRPLGILNRWGMENRRPMLKKMFFRLFEKPFFDVAAAMHFTSLDEAEDVARLGIRSMAVIIPLGIDLADFECLPSPALFLERFPEAAAGSRIVFISRVDRKKGLEMLIPAFREIQKTVTDARLVIVGDGPPQLIEELRRLAEVHGVSEAITWAGFLSGDLKLSALAAAKVFCLPSHSENFGMALLEAMAAGLPCVATDKVALAVSAARDDAVSLIPCSADAIAPDVLRLLSSQEESVKLGQAARAYAWSHHGMAATGVRLRELYETIIQGL